MLYKCFVFAGIIVGCGLTSVWHWTPQPCLHSYWNHTLLYFTNCRKTRQKIAPAWPIKLEVGVRWCLLQETIHVLNAIAGGGVKQKGRQCSIYGSSSLWPLWPAPLAAVHLSSSRPSGVHTPRTPIGQDRTRDPRQPQKRTPACRRWPVGKGIKVSHKVKGHLVGVFTPRQGNRLIMRGWPHVWGGGGTA